ncbi:hypothetical protein RhiXN_11052 [Rhizoctonia solani]|uniref:Uncharacterized protein n=1 Tax=Rhizoctonia solani TaxID=456999 RepID=A0A8H7IA48_9AGAM|nr:uncharacterized protein RhiXN_11052 [Rhizoctonia solani]KAF8752394.1 hypothetical protein RHS01_07955 [Rhizoctonia solani]QRW25975.1 hypothetical protein RhiXN_11052 [Rhizoctonia solani]
MSTIKDGVYLFALPNSSGSCISDPGEGRYLPLLPPGAIDEDAHKIVVKWNEERGGYSLQFKKSGKYLAFEGPPGINNKLLDGDKPRYFKITEHVYDSEKYAITVSEDTKYHIGLAMERIFPPWVAMSSFPEVQAWDIKKV